MFLQLLLFVLECSISCYASLTQGKIGSPCKSSHQSETELRLEYITGVGQYFILHVCCIVMQLLCLVLLYIKVMGLERKAFSMCEHNTLLFSSGCVFFLCLGIFYMFRPNMSFVAPVQEKVVVGLFFLGAILCLSFSWLFHTVYCHSEGVSRLFSK